MPTLKLNLYQIFDDAVETGVSRGYYRSHKYSDKPDSDTLKENIRQEVMSELCEIIRFGDCND